MLLLAVAGKNIRIDTWDSKSNVAASGQSQSVVTACCKKGISLLLYSAKAGWIH